MDLMVGFGCSNYVSIRQNILAVPKKCAFVFRGKTGTDQVGKSFSASDVFSWSVCNVKRQKWVFQKYLNF
jgi:hypothetical protein